jgi:hypothetical protein
LRTSIESPEVAWIPRSDVLAMIEHPAVRDRVSNMLRTGNGVIYRVYTLRPYTILSEQLV